MTNLSYYRQGSGYAVVIVCSPLPENGEVAGEQAPYQDITGLSLAEVKELLARLVVEAVQIFRAPKPGIEANFTPMDSLPDHETPYRTLTTTEFEQVRKNLSPTWDPEFAQFSWQGKEDTYWSSGQDTMYRATILCVDGNWWWGMMLHRKEVPVKEWGSVDFPGDQVWDIIPATEPAPATKSQEDRRALVSSPGDQAWNIVFAATASAEKSRRARDGNAYEPEAHPACPKGCLIVPLDTVIHGITGPTATHTYVAVPIGALTPELLLECHWQDPLGSLVACLEAGLTREQQDKFLIWGHMGWQQISTFIATYHQGQTCDTD